MKITLILASLLLSHSSLAQVTTGDGKDAAYKICSTMAFNKTACVQEVSAADFFSPEAVEACKSSFEDDELSCLRSIKNSYFQTELVNFCKPMAFNKSACMTKISNKVADVVAINACKSSFEDDEVSCVANILRPFTQSLPPLPPVSICEKKYVLGELEEASNLMKNYKVMPAFQKVLRVRDYLMGCMQ